MDNDDNWDLHAVVRGCRPGGQVPATRDPFSSFRFFERPTASLSDLSERPTSSLTDLSAAVPGLEELCRPFFSATAAVSSPRPPRRPPSQTSRSKKRKKQQKRVVCHVAADGASVDMWAWRKYGQKPIKGSPYPRGYYRCSSSKGCLARKQVERSLTDSSMLVITYTAEHNHAVPTHRNSLAGSTRNNKLSTSSCSPTTEEENESEEGVLVVEDMMELMDEDDVFIMGGELVKRDHDTSAFFDEDDYGFGDCFLPPPSWLANKNNAAAAAGGG